MFSHCPEQHQACAKLPAVSGLRKGLAKTRSAWERLESSPSRLVGKET